MTDRQWLPTDRGQIDTRPVTLTQAEVDQVAAGDAYLPSRGVVLPTQALLDAASPGIVARKAKPGPLLPRLLERIPYDTLSRFRMEAGAGDGAGGAQGGDGGNAGANDTPKTFTQAQLDQIIADRLTRDRATRADYDDLKKAAKELEDLKAAGATEQEKAIAAARKEAETAARTEERSKADTRVLRAEVKALAGTKFADPGDALRLVDLTGLKVGDDGEVDEKAITARLDELLKSKPYLAAGTVGNGTGGGLGNLGQGNRQPAGKTSGREQGLAEAERRFGSRDKQRT